MSETIDYKAKCQELELANKLLGETVESYREDLEENVFDHSDTITCQSGGNIYLKNEGINMKVQVAIDALKNYLQSGKNEQALIDFLEN